MSITMRAIRVILTAAKVACAIDITLQTVISGNISK
jgi:hypothetical protein